MTPTIEQTGQQTLSNVGVENLLKELRMSARQGNPPIKGLELRKLQLAKNNGYPKILSHQKLDPIVVLKDEEEQAMLAQGYSEQYTFREFPRYIFRRNMHPRFHKSKVELARIAQLNEQARNFAMQQTEEHDFIEDVVVKSETEAKKLMAQPVTKVQGPWCLKITAIEPFAQGPDEDPAITSARLEGELAEARRLLAARDKKN